MRHLLLREVGAGHVHHGLSMTLNKAVGRMATSRSRDDIRIVCGKVGLDGAAEELGIAVAPKSLGKPPGLSSEEVESGQDVVGGEVWNAEDPIVAGRTVDEDDNVFGTPHGHDIAEANIDVNLIEVSVASTVGRLSTSRFSNGGVRAEGGRKLAGRDEFTITRHLDEMLVVLETPTPRDAMKFLRRPAGLSIRAIRCITRSYVLESSPRVVDVLDNFLAGKGREESDPRSRLGLDWEDVGGGALGVVGGKGHHGSPIILLGRRRGSGRVRELAARLHVVQSREWKGTPHGLVVQVAMDVSTFSMKVGK